MDLKRFFSAAEGDAGARKRVCGAAKPPPTPCKLWGALVDSGWSKHVESLEPAPARLAHELRVRKARRRAPYAPTFSRSSSIFDAGYRCPGSGCFALDAVRKNQWGAPPARPQLPLRELAPRNLRAVLEAYQKQLVETLEGALDPCIDDVGAQVAQVLALPPAEFELVATLLYKNEPWALPDDPALSAAAAAGACERLLKCGVLVGEPRDAVDAVELLGCLRRDDLAQKVETCKAREKHAILAHAHAKGVKGLVKLCRAHLEGAVRLDDDLRSHLNQAHTWLFAAQGYGAEEAGAALRTIDLRRLVFAGDLARLVDTRRTDASADADKTVSKLQLLETRRRFLAAVMLRAELSESVCMGNQARALELVHKAASRLMEAADTGAAELAVMARVCLVGCNLLERERRYGDAAHYLKLVVSATECHPTLLLLHCEAALRLAKDLEHRRQKDAALAILEQVLISKRGDVLEPRLRPARGSLNRLGEFGVALLRQCARLSVPPRRWRLRVPGADRVVKPPTMQIEAPASRAKPGARGGPSLRWTGGRSVEQVVLDHFAMPEHGGWCGAHLENGFALTLFMLVMWDLAFEGRELGQLPYCELPALVIHGEWLAKDEGKRARVQERLDAIGAQGAPFVLETIRRTWKAHYGEHARGVNWERHTLDEVEAIVRCLDGKTVAMVCCLFAEHYAAWNGGLPDLMLWRSSPTESARFVEVKGPGDSLSDRQRAWIDKLSVAGTDVVVCHVVATEVEGKEGGAP